MIKRILVIISIIFPLSAQAAEDSWRFYVGLHGNESWSTTKDGNERIDNGKTRSNPNFSITAGIESKIEKYENIKLIIGGELFFDNINKTTIQNNEPYISSLGGSLARYMAGKPIYRTNFLTGLRGRFGVSLFDRVDLYGNIGLSYWERTLYLRQNRDPAYKLFIDDDLANWKIMPSFGAGARIHITDSWAIDANYTKVLNSKISDVFWDKDKNSYYYYNGQDGSITIGLEVLTIGVLYYF
ncbi:MAG: porin family protein [Rickettsiales bacterium]|jgi:opacity protein-like surface antigen|nr:porin family protein [Rickettsiales bacterium]